MGTIVAGQRVRLPVSLLGGPFPDQLLATLQVDGKDISGVLSRKEVFGIEGKRGYVRAEVVNVTEGDVVLAVPKGLSAGTFSRGGKATVPLAWARDNLTPDQDA